MIQKPKLIFIIFLTMLVFLSENSLAKETNQILDQGRLLISVDFPAGYPQILGDPTGRIHLVWLEKKDQTTNCDYDTVMYAFLDGQEWSFPVEILVSPEAHCLFEPALTYSQLDGKIHVFFSDYILYHSSAYASEASDPKAWSSYTEVDTSVRFPSVITDSSGVIHVVFLRQEPGFNVYYSKSLDGGEHWEIPILLHQHLEDTQTTSVSIVIDNRDRLHVVWTDELIGQVDAGGYVFYSRSLNLGTTWEQQLIIDEKNEDFRENYGAGEITITTVGEDTVMLVWAGAPASHRWYQWSSNGGETWYQPRMVAAEDVLGGRGLRNFNGGMSLVVDSWDRIHLFTSGSDQLSHLVWENDRWSEIDTIYDFNPYWPRAAVSLGSNMYITSFLNREKEQVPAAELGVWVSEIDTGSPGMVPLSYPQTPTPDAVETKVPAEKTETPVVRQTTVPDLPAQASGTALMDPIFPILLSGSLVIFLILAVILKRSIWP